MLQDIKGVTENIIHFKTFAILRSFVKFSVLDFIVMQQRGEQI